jgi:tetratricopeptide (TPR) repeat protein
MASVGDRARIAELRRLSAERAVRAARRWVVSDPRASRAQIALANAQIVAGDHDGATQTLERAMREPSTAAAVMPFRVAVIRMRAGRPDALDALEEALDRIGADSLRRELDQSTAQALLPAAAVAAYSGSPSQLDRVTGLLGGLFPQIPVGGQQVARRDFERPFRALIRVAMGDDSPTARADSAHRNAMRLEFSALPYVAYLVFRDERYHEAYNEWLNAESPTLGALSAVLAGDTAHARELAAAFQGAEGVTGPYAGQLRSIGEVAALIELGEHQAAVEILEAFDPRSFDHDRPDLRWAFWPRSFFVRATLYERLGRRSDAADAYRRFIELWSGADESMRGHVRAAEAGLARVIDAPGR